MIAQRPFVHGDAAIDKCNAMGRWRTSSGLTPWGPIIVQDGGDRLRFMDNLGRHIAAPHEWCTASPEEIRAKMAVTGTVPVLDTSQSARPSIVEIPTCALDVVAGLRKLADEIESGKETQARFSVTILVDEKDNTRVITYGRCTPYERAGAMVWSAMHPDRDSE